VKVIKEVWVKEISQEFCRNTVQYATSPARSDKKRRGIHKTLTFGSKYCKFGGYSIKRTITMWILCENKKLLWINQLLWSF